MHCKRCKKNVSQYAKMCPYCHAQLNKNERATRQYIEMLTENRMTYRKDGSKFDKKMGITFLSVFLAVSILLISYKDRRNQWQTSDQVIFYMQHDGLSVKDLKTGEKRRIADLSTEQAEDRAIVSAQMRTFYYNRNKDRVYYAKDISKEEQLRYTIYERGLRNWGKSPVVVAEQVRQHIWDKAGNLYYTAGESRMLYKYDGTATTAIELPLIKEAHEVEGTDFLLMIAYEPRHDGNRYDFSTYDETDGLVFYVLDTRNFTARQLFERRVESYAFTKDGTHLYYQLDNVLYDYDLVNSIEQEFEKNVYEFLLINEDEDEKLYYITYEIVEKSLYDYVKDPWKEQDEKAAKDSKILTKEQKEERKNRQSREQFRKQLIEEKLYLFEGTLYRYQNGEKVSLADKVSMLDSLYRSMIDYEPFVYRTKEIGFGSYELKKEGIEDIGSVYDMVVNLVDGQIRNYNINYESLFVYTDQQTDAKKYDVLMCCSETPYKVKDSRLVIYDPENSDEEEARSCVHHYDGKTYYISWFHNYTLFEEQEGRSRELLQAVESYQVLGEGRILVLAFDGEKGVYGLYYIDEKNKASVIEEDVTAIIGRDVWSSKGWE